MKKLLLLTLLPICAWAMESSESRLIIDASDVPRNFDRPIYVWLMTNPTEYSDIKEYQITPSTTIICDANQLYRNFKDRLSREREKNCQTTYNYTNPYWSKERNYAEYDKEVNKTKLRVALNCAEAYYPGIIDRPRRNTCLKIDMPLKRTLRIILSPSSRNAYYELTYELCKE